MEWWQYWVQRGQMNPKAQASPPNRLRCRTAHDVGCAIVFSFCEDRGQTTCSVLFCRRGDARVLHHSSDSATADGAALVAPLFPFSPACVLFSRDACVPLRCPLTRRRKRCDVVCACFASPCRAQVTLSPLSELKRSRNSMGYVQLPSRGMRGLRPDAEIAVKTLLPAPLRKRMRELLASRKEVTYRSK
jgi:hypothetical protein